MNVARRSSRRSARDRFTEAVLDLSEDPSPENLAHYLAASQALSQAPVLGTRDPRRPQRKAGSPRAA
jgi:hypothetical protein